MPKYPVTQAQAALDKWLPRMGFGHYRLTLSPLPASQRGKTWGRCIWNHVEEFVEMQTVPDGVIKDRQMEALVLHELAHGLFDYAETSEVALEVACNRLARLLTPKGTRLVNEEMSAQQSWDALAVDEDVLKEAVDHLAPDEREIIERRIWEHLSWGEIARAMQLRNSDAARTLFKRALRSLERKFSEGE